MTGPNSPREFKLIDIREVWPGEAKDFTPWLADNLEALSEHLEVGELEVEGWQHCRYVRVGPIADYVGSVP